VLVPVPDDSEQLIQGTLLSKQERHDAHRQRNPHDRNLRLVAHTLKRLSLAQICQQSPDALIFAKGPYGKPYLPGSNVQFNLSHTRGMVAMARSMGLSLGVDVEVSDHFGGLDDGLVAEQVCTSNELQIYTASQNRADCLLWFWVSKEAVLKAEALGMQMEPRQIETIMEPQPGQSLRWTFHHFSPSPRHAVAIAHRQASCFSDHKDVVVNCALIDLDELLSWEQGALAPQGTMLEPHPFTHRQARLTTGPQSPNALEFPPAPYLQLRHE
jgi:4'-phosphopantetheinyl transferase